MSIFGNMLGKKKSEITNITPSNKSKQPTPEDIMGYNRKERRRIGKILKVKIPSINHFKSE